MTATRDEGVGARRLASDAGSSRSRGRAGGGDRPAPAVAVPSLRTGGSSHRYRSLGLADATARPATTGGRLPSLAAKCCVEPRARHPGGDVPQLDPGSRRGNQGRRLCLRYRDARAWRRSLVLCAVSRSGDGSGHRLGRPGEPGAPARADRRSHARRLATDRAITSPRDGSGGPRKRRAR